MHALRPVSSELERAKGREGERGRGREGEREGESGYVSASWCMVDPRMARIGEQGKPPGLV